MQMPDVHNCTQMMLENEQLKKKLRKLRQQNGQLQRELNDMKDRQRMETMLKEFVTTRNMEVQTDPPKSFNIGIQPKKPDKPPPDNDRVGKLLTMHNSLMRRYEKELKINMQHVETITTLNLKVNELEQKLRESQIKIHTLEREKGEAVSQMRRSRSQRHRGPSMSSDEDIPAHGVLKELQKVQKERDKLVQERRKLKEELKGLDHGFFEEIEDLKFALQQSAKLNQEYEKSLRRLCAQYGLPYPNPERKIVSNR